MAETSTKGRVRKSSSEDALHYAVAKYLALALPAKAFFFHVPNGGARNPVTGAKLKRMGTVPGVPDFIVLHLGQAYAIELKAKSGALNRAQKIVHAKLAEACVPIVTARSVEEVAGFLGFFMELRGRVAA